MKVFEHLKLIGPNRRCEQTVIELWIDFTPEDCAAMQRQRDGIRQRLLGRLETAGITIPNEHPLRRPLRARPEEAYVQLFAATSLALQQHAGHRLNFTTVVSTTVERRGCAVYEFEHDEAGIDAGRLALQLLGDLIPEIAFAQPIIEDYRGFEHHLDDFLRTAPTQLLPLDAQAIIDAAARLDVPCVKLERAPYEGLKGAFRVRPNALLKLGHACRQKVIDGTFCLDSGERVAALLHDRRAVRRFLESMGWPLPPQEAVISARRAVGTAERIGYPVVVKSRHIRRGVRPPDVITPLRKPAELRSAAEHVLRSSRGLVLEAFVTGRSYKVLVANFHLIAVLALENGVAIADVTDQAHLGVVALALQAAAALKPAVMTLTVVTPDISQPPGRSAKIVNLDVAPELERFLPPEPPFATLLRRTAEALVHYLFPEGSPSRIPLVSVTGTNGKTTVCGMVARVMKEAGYCVGRAGTTGLFIDNEWLEFADLSGGPGHHRILESPRVECAVLETARGAASGMGLMFDSSEVAVCTNVTSDHLGQRGIDTVEQMAELKEFIVHRARKAVVLNADDPLSAGMSARLGPRRVCLVSTELGLGDLHARFGEANDYCIAEPEGENAQIYYHAPEGSISVMPVVDIPATFGGRAGFNVSNALHAIAVCHLLDVPVEVIRSAMAEFTPDYESNPGRLNFYHGLPFTVLFDYAHNEAGFSQLYAFVKTLPVEGRTVFVYHQAGKYPDEAIKERAGVVAGLYDVYICRNHPNLFGREPHEVPQLMKDSLIARGVKESSVVMAPGDDSLDMALHSCEAGDLLIVATTTIELQKEWEQIKRFGQEVT